MKTASMSPLLARGPSEEVRATTMAKSEKAPFDVQIFWPSRTKWPESPRADVRKEKVGSRIGLAEGFGERHFSRQHAVEEAVLQLGCAVTDDAVAHGQ